MNEILQDLKFGLRTLLKNPGVALVALATLGIGIGANAAIFSIVDDMKTLEQIKYESVAGERFRSILMGIFASVALLLAAIGLYEVISYSVVQRTREIGIRTALGANPGSIRALVLRSAMRVNPITALRCD